MKKIGFIEHEGKKLYVYVEHILKRHFRLTEQKEHATPLDETDQLRVKRKDKRVQFEEI